MWAKKSGFTIVELLVVIVAIGILTDVTIVSYIGIQDKARDSNRRAAAYQLKKAIETLAIEKGGIPFIGGYSTSASPLDSTTGLCPNNNGGGWVNYSATTYACDMGDMLKASSILTQQFFSSIPKNEEYGNDYQTANMIYHCGSKIYLYYYLKNPTTEEAANLNNIFSSCGTSFTRDTYKMKAALELNITNI